MYEKIKEYFKINKNKKHPIVQLLTENGGILRKGNTMVELDDDIIKIKFTGTKCGEMELDYDLHKMNLPTLEEFKDSFIIIDENGSLSFYYVIIFQI